VYRAGRSRLRACCWLPTLMGFGVLLSAALFEFSWRYQLPALVFAPIAGALGFTAIFRDPDARYPAARDGRQSKREVPPKQAPHVWKAPEARAQTS
jgi:hypothetical protein